MRYYETYEVSKTLQVYDINPHSLTAMKILAVLFAIFILLYGLRLLTIAGQSLFTGRVLVRRGLKTQWEPGVDMKETLTIAFKNGLMGLLLIILAIVMLT